MATEAQILANRRSAQKSTGPRTSEGKAAVSLALGRLAIKDFSNARVLDRLLMYERRIEHSLYKTLLELQRLRLMRKLENPIGADEETEYRLLLGG